MGEEVLLLSTPQSSSPSPPSFGQRSTRSPSFAACSSCRTWKGAADLAEDNVRAAAYDFFAEPLPDAVEAGVVAVALPPPPTRLNRRTATEADAVRGDSFSDVFITLEGEAESSADVVEAVAVVLPLPTDASSKGVTRSGGSYLCNATRLLVSPEQCTIKKKKKKIRILLL